MAVSLELLTDDDILDYSRSDGQERVLTSHKDINLNFGSLRGTYHGGVYDYEIFGSPFEDQCICGKIRQVSKEPCPDCGARVFPQEEALRRFARIELPFYYLNELRYEIFLDYFNEIFKDTNIVINIFGGLKRNGYCGKSSRKLGMKAFDTCQFDYSPQKKELTVSEAITDESKCSYEGLIKIIEKYFPSYLLNFKRLINRYYLVLPVAMRRFHITRYGGKTSLVVPKLSIWYMALIRFCCVDDTEGGKNKQNYNEVMSRFKTPGERVRYTALLRALINSGKRQVTELLNTSKKNKSRMLYSVRVKNSARAPIVPDTKLAVDELGVPRHLAYEMCREGFIKYLMEKDHFTRKAAKTVTEEEWDNPETQKLFKEYAEQQIVLVNRQPTLHEYSIYAMKLRLVDQDAIAYPIELCGPLNADFDGDTVSIILCPEEVKEDTYKKMSPRYNYIYKKNLGNVFEFNHETLNGLACATEVKGDPDELKDPKHFYTNYVDLLKDVEINRTIEYNTPIVFTGKIDDVKYRNKKTSYGRLRISKILGVDLDNIRIGGEKILKGQYERINAKSAAKLMTYLQSQPNAIEKANELQQYALKVVSLAGVVTFDHSTLYADADTKTYKKVREIVDSKDLSDQQKIILLTDTWKKYEKEVENEFSSDLKQELDMAGRVKMSSIVSINMPQLIISGVDEVPKVTKGNLLEGYSENEYLVHGIENRSLQSIKQSGVEIKLKGCASKTTPKCWNDSKVLNQQLT
jgi:DNA-directed RNA polymerase beta' subunit